MEANEEDEPTEKLFESNMEILRETQKRTHTKLGKRIRKSISELSTEIISTFKSIKSIFDTKEPKENEVCLIMFFNKNERFLSLYKPLMDIFCSDLIKPKFELSKINFGANKKKFENTAYHNAHMYILSQLILIFVIFKKIIEFNLFFNIYEL